MRGSLVLVIAIILYIGHANQTYAAQTCEPEKAAQRYPALAGKRIIFGVDPQTPPYASVDPQNPNQLTGVDIDLVKGILDCVGLKYEVKPAAWGGLLPAVVSGQIDLMSLLYYNPERAKQADFVIYMRAGTGGLTQAGNPKNIHGINDLCGKTVTTSLGSVESSQIKKISETCSATGKEPISMPTYSDHTSGFRLVAGGRADMLMDDLALVSQVAVENPKVYALAFSTVGDTQIGFGVKKGNDALAKALMDGLIALQASGGEKKILKKYGVEPSLQLPALLRVN